MRRRSGNWSLLLLAALVVSPASARATGQDVSVLHIKIVLVDSQGNTRPVPHHALLISDNPPTAAPRRIVTSADGTADPRLRPGSYTVESDEPVAFEGKAYQWTQTVTITAGRDATLELTADNAEVEAATAATKPVEADLSAIVMQWQDSVVTVWSAAAHGSGFLIDARGLIATSQPVVGAAESAEVQLSPSVKVAARVLAANAAKGVAILWIDPKVVASVRPVRLGYAQDGKAPVAVGQPILTIDTPLNEQKSMTSGIVKRVDAHTLASDVYIADGSSGGPVFTTNGDVIGIATSRETRPDGGHDPSGVLRIDEARDVIADAEKKMLNAQPPLGTLLPVEPTRPFPVEALKDAVQRRAGSLNAYQMTSADFDVSFITPVQLYGAQYQAEQADPRERGRRNRNDATGRGSIRPLEDFGSWSDYVGAIPPVLMIRATPKLVSGFWSSFGRAAAQTQGVVLPATKHFKAGFSRMRVYCGDVEVTPIHPFRIQRRVEVMVNGAYVNDATFEGLYVFDPGALGPQCGTVKLVLFSEKEPEKGDTRVVDAKLLQQISQDFAPLSPAVIR